MKWKHKLDVNMRMSKYFSFRTSGKKVFFPGCSLASGSPELVTKTYSHLKASDSDLGIWLSCCGMPCKKFVSTECHDDSLDKLEEEIRKGGVDEILVACGNCSKSLGRLKERLPNLKISSIYSQLKIPEEKKEIAKTYVVHHPCSARSDKSFRESFTRLSETMKIPLEKTEKEHPLGCCLVNSDSQKQKVNALSEKNLITYCGHCVQKFQKKIPSKHILQILFDMEGKLKNGSTLVGFRKIKKNIKHSDSSQKENLKIGEG
ncbi:MAG: hypothetical protein H7A24_15460 [Leptospiraceae bacterium]|nr:hypothetical protein [Leptospiraceae bacterium]MCP5513283.1 hypothetical protein [Leptospiraceae bacterium]